jgi:ABC-type sugar transport system substrate-binding protein
MRLKSARRPLLGTLALAAAGLLVAACSSSSSSSSSGSTTAQKSSGQVTIGVDLTYNNTAFWAAYINYEQQYAAQMHIKLLGPLLAAANASLQNQQIENLVNEGAQAIVVNPETATSLGPAISYATAHHVQLVSVDTIVGVGGGRDRRRKPERRAWQHDRRGVRRDPARPRPEHPRPGERVQLLDRGH